LLETAHMQDAALGLGRVATLVGAVAVLSGPAAAENIPSRVIQLHPGERAATLSTGTNRRVYRWQRDQVTEVEGVEDTELGGLRFSLAPGEYTAYDMYAGHSRNREKLLVRSGGPAPAVSRAVVAAPQNPAVAAPQNPAVAAPQNPAVAAPQSPAVAAPQHAGRAAPQHAALSHHHRASRAAAHAPDWIGFFRAIVESGRLKLGTRVADAGH
jgi:hypothetical protein